MGFLGSGGTQKPTSLTSKVARVYEVAFVSTDNVDFEYPGAAVEAGGKVCGVVCWRVGSQLGVSAAAEVSAEVGPTPLPGPKARAREAGAAAVEAGGMVCEDVDLQFGSQLEVSAAAGVSAGQRPWLWGPAAPFAWSENQSEGGRCGGSGGWRQGA